jgi:signal peptidase I
LSLESGGETGSAHASAARARGAIREVVETVLIAIVLAFVIRGFVVETFVVVGPSMEPTLHDAERLFVNKVSYRLHAPNRLDIVVFGYPRDPQRDFIKRIIGLPGDTIEMRDGRVYINGEFLEESYVAFPDHHSTTGPIEVPLEHVFVLGDNRRNSEDSRYFGPVPLENIRGKAFLLYWPLRRFGLPR